RALLTSPAPVLTDGWRMVSEGLAGSRTQKYWVSWIRHEPTRWRQTARRVSTVHPYPEGKWSRRQPGPRLRSRTTTAIDAAWANAALWQVAHGSVLCAIAVPRSSVDGASASQQAWPARSSARPEHRRSCDAISVVAGERRTRMTETKTTTRASRATCSQ